MSEPSWSRDDSPAQTLEENWLFRLRRERFRSRKTGQGHDFYVIDLADAVNVIALTPDRKLVLVEQFRAGSGRDSLETPGGLLEPNEDPISAGARELLEETGYAGDPPVVVGTTWSNPSILTSRITTVLITNVVRTARPRPDEGEEVRVELVPERRIPAMIRDGRIGHALVVQGLLWWLASDLPQSPLAIGPGRGPARKRQYSVAQVMGLVGVMALVFALVARIGVIQAVVVVAAASIPAALLLMTRLIDPPIRALLLRDYWMSPQRKVLRWLAIGGLGFGLFMLVGTLIGLVVMGLGPLFIRW